MTDTTADGILALVVIFAIVGLGHTLDVVLGTFKARKPKAPKGGQLVVSATLEHPLSEAELHALGQRILADVDILRAPPEALHRLRAKYAQEIERRFCDPATCPECHPDTAQA